MTSKMLADVPDELLLEIMGYVVCSATNGPDAVVTVDLNLAHNEANQTSKFRVRANFPLSPLRADSRMRQAYFASLQKIGITACLLSTEAAYNLPATLPRQWLLATRLLVQEVPLTDEALEDIKRREAAEPLVYSINKETLPTLQAMLVSIKSCTRNESSVVVYFRRYPNITATGVARIVFSKIAQEFLPFFGHELFRFLAHRPSSDNAWFPTTMFSVNIYTDPYAFPPGAPDSVRHDRDRDHRVLVKEGNDNTRFWDLPHTLNIRKLPDAAVHNVFDKLYLRLALNPKMARGERIMIWLVLQHPLDLRAGVSRLPVWFDSITTLGEALNQDVCNLLQEPLNRLEFWNHARGLLQPNLRLKQQGAKQGDEFIVSIKSDIEDMAEDVEEKRHRLKLWDRSGPSVEVAEDEEYPVWVGQVQQMVNLSHTSDPRYHARRFDQVASQGRL